jgi:nucleoside-diphosphate-sugar epimerase
MIFVIGGKGFVGSGVARACAEARQEFAVIDREEYADFRGRHCRVLINANGNSRKPLAKEAPLEEFDASVRTVRASLEDFSCDLYVHVSSCDVYPDCSSPATTREDQTLHLAAQSPYGFHKFLAEQCVMHRAPKWLIVRMGGFVGPGLRKNAIYDALHGDRLWLDPASELQFLSTDDAGRLILELSERAPANEIYNLCGRGVVRLSEVTGWAGRTVPANLGSPRVRYDVSIEKTSRVVSIPETRETVRRFVEAHRK